MTTYSEFAARGKVAWWRYFLVLPAAFLFAVITLVVLAFALSAAHFPLNMLARELVQPSHPAVFFSGAAVLYGSYTAAFALAILFIHGKHPRDIVGRFTVPLFLGGAMIWLAFQLALTGADYLVAPKGFSFTLTSATATLALFAALGLSVQTFAEEFIFRGWLTQGLLLATKNPLTASIISGILFGSLHIPNGIAQAANAVVFGIACSLIAIRTGGIAFTYGLHLVNNYFGAVAVVDAGDVFHGSPGIFLQNTPSLMWSDVCANALALIVIALPGELWRRIIPTKSKTYPNEVIPGK